MTKVSGKKHTILVCLYLTGSPHIHLTTSWTDYCENSVKSVISMGPAEINGILVVTMGPAYELKHRISTLYINIKNN